ncbi:MAG: hypothetical protein H6985_11890 [Pseudomonadales bacterium]|nr:hypothetical protein [Pseudomonadales bacterium]
MTMELLKNPETGTFAVFGELERAKTSYKGPERRLSHRRQRGDRRAECRFELDKPDRRVSDGRRSTDMRSRFR